MSLDREPKETDQFQIPKLELLSSHSMKDLQKLISQYQLMPIIITVLLLGLGAGGYFFYQSQKVSQFRTTPTGQILDNEQIKNLVAEVKNKTKLPQGEDPNVATIVDIGKLKDQPFFAEGKNGDMVLMYANAKKVFLYDPTAKKIVNIAPLTEGNTTTPQQQIQAKIAIVNGSSATGLAAKMETEIKKVFPEANIVSKENAKKNDHPKTIVVVLNKEATEAASNLAKALNISIADLPEVEEKPTNADILILVGKDRT